VLSADLGRIENLMAITDAQRRWRAKHPEVKAAERLRYYRQFHKNNRHEWKKWLDRKKFTP
jgi:hypothetical protein